MKLIFTIISALCLLGLVSMWSGATTTIQTQDIGLSSVTFSGTETFYTVIYSSNVSISTVSVNLSGQTGVSAGVRYSVGIATLTYTVSGIAPVVVCFSGSITENGTGPENTWSFSVDGVFVDGLTSNIGAYPTASGATNGGAANVTGCYPIKAGVVSAGSHKFQFIPSGGAGNTWTISSSGVDKFWVYELH